MDTTVLNTKINKTKSKIQDFSALVTTTVLDTKIGAVENKIPGVSGLVKKMDYNAKISNTEAKYLTTSDYNKFISEILVTKIKKKD